MTNREEKHQGLPLERKRVGDWTFGPVIGNGSSGKVKLATNERTNETCVVKCIRRPTAPQATDNMSTATRQKHIKSVILSQKKELYMLRETYISTVFSHPNIPKCIGSVLGQHHFYVLFEYAEGVDLVDFIQKSGRITENLSRNIFSQVVDALHYIHANSVVHRDIKLEVLDNLLWQNIRYNEQTGKATLLDFGFASFWSAERRLITNCGSPCYAAPEIYSRKEYIGPEVDVWSLGICIYASMTGRLPFKSPSFLFAKKETDAMKIHFPAFMSSAAVDLITNMLKINPEERLSIHEIIRHPWFRRTLSRYSKPKRHIQHEFIDEIMQMTMTEAAVLLMDTLGETFVDARLKRTLSSRTAQGSLPRDTTRASLDLPRLTWKDKLKDFVTKISSIGGDSARTNDGKTKQGKDAQVKWWLRWKRNQTMPLADHVDTDSRTAVAA